MSAPAKRPDVFDWNTCITYCGEGRSDMAIAMALTFVSQQLDGIIERLDGLKSTGSNPPPKESQ